MEEKIERTMKGLQSRQFAVRYAQNSAEAREILAEYILPGQRIGAGGSLTLKQLDFAQLAAEKGGVYLDRDQPGLTAEERLDICRQQMAGDVFCCSSNAITEDGCLLNMDGTGNRVASMIFGPKQVVIVAGSNKIVPDLAAAYERLRTVVAPGNCQRLQRKTPCAVTGHCMDCRSKERICRATTILEFKPLAVEMTIILVGEPLGL